MIDHVPPKPLPINHLAVVEVPQDFSAVVVAGAEKEGRLFSDQIIHLAILGAECARTHAVKSANPRRKKA